MEDQILLSIPDACRRLGIGRTSLYALIARGEIQARKLGSRTLVPLASLREFTDKLPTVGAAQ